VNDQEQSINRTYELWRLDDNGNAFHVDTFEDRKPAEARLAMLAAGAHKQVYWIKEKDI